MVIKNLGFSTFGLNEMDYFFEQVGLLDNKKVGFANMKLIGRTLSFR